MNDSPRKIMISAGEPSGDMHAAELIKALGASPGNGRLDCFGMGLEQMQRAGLRRLVDASELSLVGLFEVLAHYPKLRRAYRRLVRALREETPDLLVLVDYPEFNLKLAAAARRLGIKTLFYISPQVWAWRAGRIRTIARRIDMMAVVFPFEEKIYRDAGIPVRYVGHPLLDQLPAAVPPVQRDDGQQRVLLMPGSRLTEVRRLLPVITAAAAGIARRTERVRFALLLAPGIPAALVEQQLAEHGVQCELVREEPYALMRESALAITASGTSTLQLALCQTPMVIIYKLSPPTYWLVRRLVQTPHIGLVNIVAGKRLVPELVQGEANADAICREAMPLLEDTQKNRQLRRELRELRQVLGDDGSTLKLAGLVREMLGLAQNPAG